MNNTRCRVSINNACSASHFLLLLSYCFDAEDRNTYIYVHVLSRTVEKIESTVPEQNDPTNGSLRTLGTSSLEVVGTLAYTYSMLQVAGNRMPLSRKIIFMFALHCASVTFLKVFYFLAIHVRI